MATPHPIHILTEDEFLDRIDAIEASLDAVCREGMLTTFDERELYYRWYPTENSVGTVVLVHGLSEFTEKFYELSWYLREQGYSVLVYDQRGHGRSSRLTEPSNVLHVDRFDDYAEDLNGMVTQVAVPFSDGKPLYLLGHSMGGAVVCLYLAAHPDTPVQKAVLSAPLMIPHLKSMPMWLARLGTAYEWRKAGRGDVASMLSHPFNPNALFENSPDASRARFERNLQYRRDHPRNQTVMKSIGWNREALYIHRRLLSKSLADAIRTPLLLISAEADTVVKTKPHRRFAAQCACCRLYAVADAKHCLFTGEPAVYEEFLTQTLTFFRDPV